MRVRAISLASVLLALAYGSVAVLWPEQTLSPGHLLPGHVDLTDDCLRCHRVFGGTPTESCTSCHPLEKIDARPVSGDRAGATVGALHTMFRDPECGACHAEHAATLNRRPPVRFAHTALASSARDRCGGCHASPADSLHASLDERCGLCHGTDRWTPARYDHDRYFRFDRAHPADCSSCHPGGDLKRYTCYECHEHSPRGMAREHREEGIRNFEACAECHRSGDEHDIERRGDRRGGGEYRARRGRDRRYGDHDDDDDDDDDDD